MPRKRHKPEEIARKRPADPLWQLRRRQLRCHRSEAPGQQLVDSAQHAGPARRPRTGRVPGRRYQVPGLPGPQLARPRRADAARRRGLAATVLPRSSIALSPRRGPRRERKECCARRRYTRLDPAPRPDGDAHCARYRGDRVLRLRPRDGQHGYGIHADGRDDDGHGPDALVSRLLRPDAGHVGGHDGGDDAAERGAHGPALHRDRASPLIGGAVPRHRLVRARLHLGLSSASAPPSCNGAWSGWRYCHR
jgi:hypothetical protein